MILFIQEIDIEKVKSELESLGKQANVKIIVQPCPYEGIEFLCRVSGQLIGHRISVDKDLFWQAMELMRNTPSDIATKIANHQHAYLCAILEQNAKVVEKEGREIQSFSDYYF